jgi:hypothetical protein
LILLASGDCPKNLWPKRLKENGLKNLEDSKYFEKLLTDKCFGLIYDYISRILLMWRIVPSVLRFGTSSTLLKGELKELTSPSGSSINHERK